MKKNIMTVICYKVRKPMFSVDTFLAYYTYKSVEEAEAECEQLNSEKPAKLWNGNPVDWNNVEYFFASRQEEMY